MRPHLPDPIRQHVPRRLHVLIVGGGASGALMAAHLLLFVPGIAWLAAFVGWERAAMAGFVLFLPGTAVKTALAWVLLRGLRPRPTR